MFKKRVIMHKAPELNFIPGLVVKEEFLDYKSLQNGAKNYLYITKFRLGSGPFYGIHAGIQLKHMQVGYADRYEGLMYDGWAPRDCITIGVLKHNKGAVNVNRLKIEENEIVVADDSAPHVFASSDRAAFVILSIRKSLVAKVVPQLLKGTDQVYKDKNNTMLTSLSGILEEVESRPGYKYNADEIEAFETRVLDALHVQFEIPAPIEHPLNEYEDIAFDVKDFILENLTEECSVSNLTERFSISDKSLEKYFSTLFGITPKKLITQLKLNQVHKELCYANAADVSVTDVAQRWGFSHLGRFSNTYKDVFGTLPSEDLKLTS